MAVWIISKTRSRRGRDRGRDENENPKTEDRRSEVRGVLPWREDPSRHRAYTRHSAVAVREVAQRGVPGQGTPRTLGPPVLVYWVYRTSDLGYLGPRSLI